MDPSPSDPAATKPRSFISSVPTVFGVSSIGLMLACGDFGSGTGPVSGSGATACDTDAPMATSGGDHGPPFEFASGADETGVDDGGTGVLPQESTSRRRRSGHRVRTYTRCRWWG